MPSEPEKESVDEQDRWVRDLAPGTELRNPFTGERLTLTRHTDFDDGWWLSDTSWLRWHHVAQWLAMEEAGEDYLDTGDTP